MVHQSARKHGQWGQEPPTSPPLHGLPQYTNWLPVLGAGLPLPGSCAVPLASGAPTEVPRGEQPPAAAAAPAAVAAAAAT